MATLRSAVTIPALCAVIGSLLFAGCSRPEKPKEAPKQEEPAPVPKALQEQLPGEIVEVDGKKYVQADCDCDDEQDKTVWLDTFFEGAKAADEKHELKQYIDEHMKEKPLCRKATKNQSVTWKTKKDGYQFQILKFVNAADDQEEVLFETKFPSAKGHETKSKKMKSTAPSASTSGKCYVFKAYVRMYKKDTGYIDIDPHVGSHR